MFAVYPLTVEEKVAMFFLTFGTQVGGNEAHGIAIDSSKHSHVKPPAKNPECEIANTHLKVVGIYLCAYIPSPLHPTPLAISEPPLYQFLYPYSPVL